MQVYREYVFWACGECGGMTGDRESNPIAYRIYGNSKRDSFEKI